jgi:hypothetical protein
VEVSSIIFAVVVIVLVVNVLVLVKGKGKGVRLQAWSGPEGFKKLRFPDFFTTAQDGGKVVSFTHRPHLSPENTPGTHFY